MQYYLVNAETLTMFTESLASSRSRQHMFELIHSGVLAEIVSTGNSSRRNPDLLLRIRRAIFIIYFVSICRKKSVAPLFVAQTH